MQPTEEMPLWDSVAEPFASALERAFGCHHGKLSRVFTIDGRTYKVCCDCGARFRYSLDTMSIVAEHRHRFPVLRRLRAGRLKRKLLRRHERA
ncbi:MAG TPA: hypothetical protein VKV39_03625 [Candidatus Sulfotelmatobacter sp.]|nr:hypothetical protein [Candidatus Sulfotelmatobacter sp.]